MKNEQISGCDIQIFEHDTVGSQRFVNPQVGWQIPGTHSYMLWLAVATVYLLQRHNLLVKIQKLNQKRNAHGYCIWPEKCCKISGKHKLQHRERLFVQTKNQFQCTLRTSAYIAASVSCSGEISHLSGLLSDLCSITKADTCATESLSNYQYNTWYSTKYRIRSMQKYWSIRLNPL